jgi:serine/threonine protein phosphatase PrpC
MGGIPVSGGLYRCRGGARSAVAAPLSLRLTPQRLDAAPTHQGLWKLAAAMPSLSTIVVVGSSVLLISVFNISYTFIFTLGLLLMLLLSASRPSMGAEQFSPVYTAGVSSGLQYGVAAVQGRRPYMEDMHQIVDFDDQPAAASVGMTHFFAVFDGHGGKRAAAWAHEHLVTYLLQELTGAAANSSGRVGAASGVNAGGGLAGAVSPPAESASSILDGAAVDAFHRTDAAFLRQAAARGIPDGSTAVTCMIQCMDASCHGASPANSSRGGSGAARSGGGAAGERRLLVANLGDSRCVMVRTDGSALALSSDHKPNRPDERARVQAAGGQVRPTCAYARSTRTPAPFMSPCVGRGGRVGWRGRAPLSSCARSCAQRLA